MSGKSTPSRASQTSTPVKRDLQSTWEFLESGVELIMTRLREGMSYAQYMSLYTALYDFCTDTRMSSGSLNGPLGFGGTVQGGANLRGGELYRMLGQYYVNHLEKTREPADSLTNESLLQYYCDEWDRYTTGAVYVHRLFAYLNRHWVKREKEEGRRNIYIVYTLALVQWRDHFFGPIQTSKKLTDALLKIIEKQRNGEAIESRLIKRVVDSFVALGVDETDSNRQLLELYWLHFEKPFLEATKVYYRRESETFISENSATDYMKKAETRLREEEDLVDMLLPPSSKKALINTCEDVLLHAHMEMIQEEFQRLLINDMEDDLLRMYSLLSRISGGLEPLRTRFEEHVKRAGLESVEKVVTDDKDADIEPKQYVDALLIVHRRNFDLVSRAFKGEPGFNASLDKACREFVNRNKATGNAAQKSPELLAKYTDTLLKKSNKAGEESDLEDALNQVMTVFKYIEEKDVFQTFYSKHLAKRLIQASSASDDAEQSMISKLKDACGYEYTSKLARMFQDIRLCKDLNDSFRKLIDQGDEEAKDAMVDFNISVLSTGSWPLSAPTTDLTIPLELVKTHDRFVRFYENKHSGRKLTWLWQLSKNELRTTYTGTKYFFMTSTYQAAVLLQYNAGSDSLTYGDLKDGTKLDDNILKAVLGQLEKAKVLIRNDDTYDLNLNFRSKKVRVNLNTPIKSEAKAEQQDVMRTVDEDRKLLIQAIIVRIMKSRKQMRHQQLIQETITQLSSRFNPKVPDIKKAIDTLLDKDYLERVEGQRDMWQYVA